MRMKTAFLGATVLSAITFPPLAISAHAQTAAASGSSGIEDIIVTARRVEESLQTTPVSVTALSPTVLVQQQVIDIRDLQRAAPGIVIRQGIPSVGSFGAIGIRGQNNLNPSLMNDPAVGIYVDGVYMARPNGAIMDMVDLQRLEVLRGPQGTLFGRNTTGGALNITTKDPANTLGAEFNGELGNFDHRKAQVVLNAPLAPSLAARVVYMFKDRDGWGHNAFLDRDVSNEHTHFVRGKLKYDGDGLDVTLAADYTKANNHGQLNTFAAFNPAAINPALLPSLAGIENLIHSKSDWWTHHAKGTFSPTTNPLYALLPDEAKRRLTRPPYDLLKNYGASLTIDLDAGPAHLKSISSYRYLFLRGLVDSDSTNYDILATFAGSHSKQYAQEIQLTGDISDKLNYIAGGYISRETGYDYSDSQIFAGLPRRNYADALSVTKGLFAQLYYKINDDIRVAGGFRYTWDKRQVDIRNRQVADIPPDLAIATTSTGFNCTNSNIVVAAPADRAAMAAECKYTRTANFSYPAWTAGIDWQATPEVFLYAKTSGAARAGGWNFRAGAFPSFRPEKVKDVEAGAKLDLFDRRLRLNSAAFYTWKKDIHAILQSFDPVLGPVQGIQNNGNARIWGAEFEMLAEPAEGMLISSSVTLLDGKYESGTYNDLQRINFPGGGAIPAGCVAAPQSGPTPQIDCTVDLSKTPLIQLPKFQFNFGVTQTIPTDRGEFTLHLDYAYVSKQQMSVLVAADAQPQAVKDLFKTTNDLSTTSGYGTFNARAGFTFNQPDLELYVFARNLTNKKYVASAFGEIYNTLGIGLEYPGAPRMWGAGITWKFGEGE